MTLPVYYESNNKMDVESSLIWCYFIGISLLMIEIHYENEKMDGKYRTH